jgi:pyruvate/2-oxoacid:ferredoxin oxidoreductase alpha subunit
VRASSTKKPRGRTARLFEAEDLEDADVVVVSYGITSRVAQRAINWRAKKGIRAGKFRLISAWPFPARTSANWPAASRPSWCRS